MLEIPFLYPQGESNAYRRNRNPKFYPLNYGGESVLFRNRLQKYEFVIKIGIILLGY